MAMILPDKLPTSDVMNLLLASLRLKDVHNMRRTINTLAARKQPEPLMQVLMRHDTVTLDDSFASALGSTLIGALSAVPQEEQHGFILPAYIGLQITRARQEYYDGERQRDFFSIRRDFTQPITAVAGLVSRIGGNLDTIVDEHADLLIDLGLDADGILEAHRLLRDGAIDSVIRSPAVNDTPCVGIDAGKFYLALKREEIFDK